ncbi:uncharacterized protein BDV17DRAFT_290103 [Aspergillus undulatus]|uniref:uncharacterized protein n=1 Tax=Aspergillus undulatus TaxID=1810928 RepID=UPI003CCE31ED
MTAGMTSLTQAITLRVLLCVLFPYQGDAEYETLVRLGGIIHRVSMNTTRGPERTGTIIDFEDSLPLHRALADVFPDHDMDDLLRSRSNPSSLITPGFEPRMAGFPQVISRDPSR